jgi:C-terminal processing protease CtpA/Prc
MERYMRFLTIFVLIFLLSGCFEKTVKKLTDTSNNQETTDSEDTNYAEEKPLTDLVQNEYPPSKNFANICSNPRQNNKYQDLAGDYVDENNWIRSWSHETYLWYNELPNIDPASIQDPIKYFEQMKTSAITSSGSAKDRFHFAVDTAESELLSETGISVGYGASAKQDRETGRVYVTYTEPDSPARNANISRGTEILAAGGVFIGSVITDKQLDIFNSALLPETAGESHNFTIRRPDSILTENVKLTSTMTTEIPVHRTQAYEASGKNIGYLVLNSFSIEAAEIQLINAINQLKSAQISELILDLRYNGGGYLGISGVLGTMIAGDKAYGQVFENIIFNDKHSQYDPIYGQLIEPYMFPETTLGYSTKAGIPLPNLNLSRVFIISTSDTASASEALINSLRGIDIEVILIGEKTHGKPYGFYGQDNCGTTYYTIQFKGTNAKGYGGYAEGFIPSAVDNGTDRVKGCLVSDDLSSALGNTNEKMLGTALHYILNDRCPIETMPLRSNHSLISSMRGDVIRRHPTEVIMLR